MASMDLDHTTHVRAMSPLFQSVPKRFKGVEVDTAMVAPQGRRLVRARSPRSPGASQTPRDQLLQLFSRYSGDESPFLISGPGMLRFFGHLDVHPNDMITLALTWKWGCAEGGVFTRDDFVQGMKSMNCFTLPDLSARLTTLRHSLADWEELKRFYIHTFHFARVHQTDDTKTLGLPLASSLLLIVLQHHFPVHARNFCAFLNHVAQIRSTERLLLDQWASFLEFCRIVKPNSVQGYNPDAAWPVLLDEYCQWFSHRKSQQHQPYQSHQPLHQHPPSLPPHEVCTPSR